MKSISFFSKFTLICNIAFLLLVFFNRMEAKTQAGNGSEALKTVPFFKDLIIILGFSAIIINLLMCITYLVYCVIRKSFPIPKWLTIVNFIFLPLQFYFFFS